MRIACLFVVAIAASAAASTWQDPAAREDASTIPAIATPDDPQFAALSNAYLDAQRDYDRARLQVGRKQLAPEKLPAHPAIAWYPRFEALADQKSGAALGWMLANLVAAKKDDAERARLAPEILARLLEDHAGEPAMFDAIVGLRLLLDSLGEIRVIELCQQIVDASSHPEIQARALLTHAWVLTKKHKDEPEKLAQAAEIHRAVAFGYAGTTAAREATNSLYPVVDREFLAAERQWIADVEELQAAGKPPESWPEQPMHTFLNRFVPLAGAGNKYAKQWVDQLYPAYAQAARQGPSLGLSWLASSLASHYGFDPATWTGVQIGILRILYRQFPAEPWVLSSLEGLKQQAGALPIEMLEPALEPLRAKSAERKVRATATFLLAHSARGCGDQQSCERALTLYQQVIDEFPGASDHGIAFEAATQKKNLERVMPGAAAPAFHGKDAEGLEFDLADYLGRVVVFEFWRAQSGLSAADAQARNELAARLLERPFHWIGANVDSMTVVNYYARAQALGVKWRSALLESSGAQVIGWGVRAYPTTYVIDAEGVIRGRNLPWDEMVELIERLVLEAESKALKK